MRAAKSKVNRVFRHAINGLRNGSLSWVVRGLIFNGPQPLEDASSESGFPMEGSMDGRSLWMTGGPHFGLGGAWADAGWSDFAGFSLKFVSRAKGRTIMGLFFQEVNASGSAMTWCKRIPYEIVQFMRS